MNATEPKHVDYPHHPGTLYDCPACCLDDYDAFVLDRDGYVDDRPHGEEQSMIDYMERDYGDEQYEPSDD